MTEEDREAPLPATLGFTLIFGALMAIGWLAFFLLLRSRW
jgi:hypothetical protein